MEPNSVCNHTSDNKIGRPRSGSPICLSPLYDTKSKERSARMLLSNVKHWKAKQMFIFKNFASSSFQLEKLVFHTTHFKSSCLQSAVSNRKEA